LRDEVRTQRAPTPVDVPGGREVPGADVASIERRALALERRLAQAQARERRARAEAGHLARALEEAERDRARLADLEAQLRGPHEAEYWLDVVQSSLSWRVTRPLRWLGRRRRPARRASGEPRR
jgi:hypothetical protein